MKYNFSFKCIVLLFCLISGILNAQETPGVPNDLDKLFVPDKNSIFNSENKSDVDNSTSGLVVKNVIKFNPSMLTRNIAVFSYQRILSDQISIEGGLGSCFDKDKIFGTVSDISDELSNNQSVIKLSRIMQSGDFNSNSLFASISFRVNWTSYNWDYTPYFEINTRYYSNKLKLNRLNNNSRYEVLDGTPEVIVKNTSFNLIYGIQYITEGKIKTSHDFYMGFGMRNTSFDAFTSAEIQASPSNYRLYSKAPTRSKTLAPSFIMGYVFGIGF